MMLQAADFVLYKNGKPQADLLLEDISSFTKQEQKYILNIVDYFHSSVKKCKLPEMKLIRKRSAAGNKGVLILSPVKKTLEKMDEYVIDFPSRNTMRITCSHNSLKYALDDLLQKHFSVRFLLYSPPCLKAPKGYARSMEYIYPALKEVKVPRKRIAEKSSFNLKRVFTGGHPKEWKIRIAFFGVHGMTAEPFPARKYAADNSWPKEILPVHNGKKICLPKLKKSDPKKLKNLYYARVGQYTAYRSHWQPCFSHPKTATIAAENLIELLDKEPINPLYGIQRYNLNLDVNDCGGFCECNKCLSILEARRKLGRSGYSEMYWKWVNDVAHLVTKKYPKVYFNCLAYREVLAPPSFKLHKNVIVQVCKELNAGFSPEEKERITALFKNWKAKATTLFLWDYCFGASWYVFPRIFFNTHAQMLKIAYENNVRGGAAKVPTGSKCAVPGSISWQKPCGM